MAEAEILIAIILDRSGSMMGRTAAVIEHFNAYKEEVANMPQLAKMSVYQFDTVYDTIIEDEWANLVPDLTPQVYFARGGTALLDAIGRTIAHIDALTTRPDKIVIVINTDGHENSSHEFTHSQIKEMIKTRQEQFDWQFVFIGADIDAFSVGTSFGIYGSNTFTTSNDSTGYSNAYYTLSNTTRAYTSGRGSTMDMSGIYDNPPVDNTTSTANEELQPPKKKKREKETSESR